MSSIIKLEDFKQKLIAIIAKGYSPTGEKPLEQKPAVWLLENDKIKASYQGRFVVIDPIELKLSFSRHNSPEKSEEYDWCAVAGEDVTESLAKVVTPWLLNEFYPNHSFMAQEYIHQIETIVYTAQNNVDALFLVEVSEDSAALEDGSLTFEKWLETPSGKKATLDAAFSYTTSSPDTMSVIGTRPNYDRCTIQLERIAGNMTTGRSVSISNLVSGEYKDQIAVVFELTVSEKNADDLIVDQKMLSMTKWYRPAVKLALLDPIKDAASLVGTYPIENLAVQASAWLLHGTRPN